MNRLYITQASATIRRYVMYRLHKMAAQLLAWLKCIIIMTVKEADWFEVNPKLIYWNKNNKILTSLYKK